MFDLILETRKEILEDFEKNKERYFRQISEIAQRFDGRAYIFGSYLRGEALGGSDVDILIVIPNHANRIEILKQLSQAVQNPRFEFHIIFEREEEIYFRLIGNLKKI